MVPDPFPQTGGKRSKPKKKVHVIIYGYKPIRCQPKKWIHGFDNQHSIQLAAGSQRSSAPTFARVNKWAVHCLFIESGVITPLLKNDNLIGSNDVDDDNDDCGQIMSSKPWRRGSKLARGVASSDSSASSRDIVWKQLESEAGNSIRDRTCS
ncbi:hypothetical protein GX50_02442 [[Emmonsia] crescens]|uniref:Uncharacterized protein n=1 Tax=[Emmonsia] crescens TaxID=73230 RepID=A0A2B7ZN07_9EURO|nr:hypothetical protein GX50_02442 [Emmonsia crescens]